MSSSNSSSSSSLDSRSSDLAGSLAESIIGSPPPSNSSSSIKPNADSDQTPPPGKSSPPPSSPPPSSASPPPDSVSSSPPTGSSLPPSPSSASPKAPPSSPSPPPPSPPLPSPPPPSSSPLPSPPPPSVLASSSSPPSPPLPLSPPSSSPPTSLPPPPSPSSSSQSPLPLPAMSPPPSLFSEDDSSPSTLYSSASLATPPPGSSLSGEFIPPPPPLTTPSPGSSSSSSGSPPPPSRNSTPGLGTSATSDRTSYSIPSSSSSSSGSSSSAGGSNPSSSTSTGTVLGAAAGGVFVITLMVLVLFIVRKSKKKDDNLKPQYAPAPNFVVQADGAYYGQNGHNMRFSGQSNHSHYATQGSRSGMGNGYGNVYNNGGGVLESGTIGETKSVFSYEELMEITNGFSRQNIIGEGGFGCVYKGLLPGGRAVAVKQLKMGSGQGDREFRAEVEIISRVHHRHLVSLVGYCILEQQRLLIYEFVPNKTLEHHLHAKGMPVLEWTKRVKIALGSAKGLAYLHEDCHPKIIHRDIKSANILLDDAYEAQVADFGLAKLNNDTDTHVSTRVMGTFGYLAPEYATTGKLTDRSDVFSFGVVLLELVTGRKPVDASQPIGDESLVEWARPLLIRALETGDLSELVDPQLGKSYVESEMLRMIEAAAACIRHSAPKRPRMVQVVRALDSEGQMSDLSNGVKYGQSTVYNSSQYSQDIMRFRMMAIGFDDSMEYGTSGEYSRTQTASWKSQGSSSEFTSGESETWALNTLSGGKRL